MYVEEGGYHFFFSDVILPVVQLEHFELPSS